MAPFDGADAARRELARRLGAGMAPLAPSLPAITPRPAGLLPPMTEEQKHVWLDSEKAPDEPIYNEPITLHYHGAFDPDVFRRSFDELLRRHEAWRTCFAFPDEGPKQIVQPDMHVDFPLVDLSDLPPAAREEEATALAMAHARRPFRLDEAPLFRGRIVRFADDEHRIYITLHHIIFDGVSIYRIMMPELAAIYAAFAEGRQPDLRDPPVQYGDYAVWQESLGEQPSIRRQLDYWKRTLAGELPMLQLPTDRPRPAMPTSGGAMETFELERGLVARLKTVGKARGATLYMTLLAAFKVLLHRYGGQEDIVIGGVTDTRRRPELQQMLGYCLNGIPLRSRPQADLPFSAFLMQIRGVVADALENSDVSFSRVVQALRVRTGDGRHPIFQILFSVEPPAPEFAPGWDLTQMDVPLRTAKFDLYLELDERPDGSMAARIMYGSDLFDAETIRRMIGHWTTLLGSIADAPDAPLRALRYVGAEEEATLLALSVGPERAIPDTTVHGMVRAAAIASPEATAVRFGRERWSYTELRQRTDEIGRHIAARNVRPGDIVALCLDRSPDMIAGALAIMEAGATYLPLDPAFPATRLSAIVASADPVLLLSRRSIAAELPSWGIPLLACDALPALKRAPTSWSPTDPSAIAYVMYTSGSTGVPKGVEISHRAVVNLLRAMAEEPGFAASDTLLAVTTTTFDISILEMFLPLVCGGTVAIATREEATDPLLLQQAIAASGCTVMQATPATWRGLFAAGWEGVPGLKALCGGEALAPDLAGLVLGSGMTLWNMFGPTETTIWSSVHPIAAGARIAIGRPIANTRFLVLDGEGRVQPFNVPGDLYIAGAGLARGYRDPVLTAKAFVQLPVMAGERLYRSGDIAALRRDGTFEWLGRSDGQVKIRGFRIDLGDVEAALSAHPGIAISAVRPFDEPGGQKGLAAYVVPAGGQVPSAVELREHLARLLPGYMIPVRYRVLDAMPLSPAGKVDRKRLPDPGDSAMITPLAPELPATETEERLARMWGDILSLDTVDVNADFQDLGGHSLLAARLMGRVAAGFGRRLPLSAMLRAPTVRTMAALLDQDAAVAAPTRLVTVQGGSQRPLFWVDAVPNFRPGQYRALGRAIGPDQPLIGLPIDLERHDHLRGAPVLAEVAADLVDAVLQHPSGPPYRIGGWCNGGILAMEVAQQLMERGGEVGILLLLDTANPTGFRKRRTRITHQLRQIMLLPRRQRLSFAVEIAKSHVGRFRRRHLRPGGEAAELLDLNDRFMRLVKSHEPVDYPGPVTLFQPIEGAIDYRPGWSGVMTGDFQCYDAQGGHVTVLEAPHVSDLGSQIARCLEMVEQEGHLVEAAE